MGTRSMLRKHRSRILRIVGMLAGAFVLLSMSALLLADTSFGRAAIAKMFASYASNAQRGTITIDSLDDVGFDRWLFRGYRVLDTEGREVLHVGELEARWDVDDLITDGQMRFRPAWFRNATIRLLPRKEGGQISVIHALEVPDGRFWVPIHMDDMRIIDNTIHVDLPGKPAVSLTKVHGLATLHMGNTFKWRLDEYRGHLDVPVVQADFSDMSGRLRSDNPAPLRAKLVLDLKIAEPQAKMTYRVPSIDGKKGEPHLDLDLPQM